MTESQTAPVCGCSGEWIGDQYHGKICGKHMDEFGKRMNNPQTEPPPPFYVAECLAALVSQAERYMLIAGCEDAQLECGIMEARKILSALKREQPERI